MDMRPVRGCFDCCSQASRSCMQYRKALIMWVMLQPLLKPLMEPIGE